MYRADTIVACATPPGRGAIAIVRLSGPDCRALAAALFRAGKGALDPWRMRHGTILGRQLVDDGLAVFFPAPRTYTGEDMLELHCHGSSLVVEDIIAAAVAAGARSAEPGEFSRRAVLNGRMDLLQAEAVADLIDARVSAGARAAWAQLQGALSERIGAIRALLVAVLADIEAHVDFSDDELPDENWPRRRALLEEVTVQIEDLLGSYAASRRQREGLRVVVTGRPNAGKSSLINRLLGSDRMIVTAEAGTTRDVVEESVDLGGMAFVLTDTAGLRTSDSLAETEAVSRARAAASDADIVLYVVDRSERLSAEDVEAIASIGDGVLVLVLNKCDRDPGLSAQQEQSLASAARATIRISARTGAGCDELAQHLQRQGNELCDAQPTGISRVRHRVALQRALEVTVAARELMDADGPAELAAFEIRAALHEMAGVTQAVDSEEVLDVIFGEFCIGK